MPFALGVHPRKMNTRSLYLLAVLATVSSVCVWKAVWNLLEIYLLPYTAWSEVICGVCGLVGLWASSSLVNFSGVVDQTTVSPEHVWSAETGT